MVQIQALEVDFLLDKLDLGLLIRMDKLKGILWLYTADTDKLAQNSKGICVGVCPCAV